ncbi:hypothetical protein V1515DRAFT_595225 [Lipomyces mesembrius]
MQWFVRFVFFIGFLLLATAVYKYTPIQIQLVVGRTYYYYSGVDTSFCQDDATISSSYPAVVERLSIQGTCHQKVNSVFTSGRYILISVGISVGSLSALRTSNCVYRYRWWCVIFNNE